MVAYYDRIIRLEKQIKDYCKVFSYVYVAVVNRQLPCEKEFLKEQKVGIYELTSNGKLICRKKFFSIRRVCHMRRCFKSYVKRKLNLFC